MWWMCVNSAQWPSHSLFWPALRSEYNPEPASDFLSNCGNQFALLPFAKGYSSGLLRGEQANILIKGDFVG